MEEAEAWGDEVFQMAARRLGLMGPLHGLDNLRDRGNSGRLGALLSPNERLRVLATKGVTATAFKANAQVEDQLVAELPALLDRIDLWIGAGVLGGEELNAADCMIAPSIALIAYRLTCARRSKRDRPARTSSACCPSRRCRRPARR